MGKKKQTPEQLADKIHADLPPTPYSLRWYISKYFGPETLTIFVGHRESGFQRLGQAFMNAIYETHPEAYLALCASPMHDPWEDEDAQSVIEAIEFLHGGDGQ